MPEGPEVEVLKRDLEKVLINKSIVSMFRTTQRPWVVNSEIRNILNDKIISVNRVGKFIVISHESSRKTIIHLSFTGVFSFNPQDFEAFHIILNDGTKLYYSDKRGLSKVYNVSLEDFNNNETLKSHGPDGLYAEIPYLKEALRSRSNAELKPYLLDYHHISGIGNIYGSEICFRSKISPKKKVSSLSEEEIDSLAISIHDVLNEAFILGGSSIEDFKSLYDKEGKAQTVHKVYHKTRCPICDAAIVSFKQNNRMTFYCPICQR